MQEGVPNELHKNYQKETAKEMTNFKLSFIVNKCLFSDDEKETHNFSNIQILLVMVCLATDNPENTIYNSQIFNLVCNILIEIQKTLFNDEKSYKIE